MQEAKDTAHHVNGVILKPGDRVLVHHMSERGGPGKLRSDWKRAVSVVKERINDRKCVQREMAVKSALFTTMFSSL